MNRRAPVRSVLAERRMFANGGMLPISTPFQNTMNQGQPSGILASSSPLIDSVSQEILAPLTGGAMPMAQGGVAKFQEGGSIGALTQNPEDFLQEGSKLVESGFFILEELDAYTQLRAFGLGQAGAMLGLNSINTFRAENPNASESEAINSVVRNSWQELSLTAAERNILDRRGTEALNKNIVPGPYETLGPQFLTTQDAPPPPQQMAQGGVAKFQDGGFAAGTLGRQYGFDFNPQGIEIEMVPSITPIRTLIHSKEAMALGLEAPIGAEATYDPNKPTPMSYGDILSETASKKVRRIFPNWAETTKTSLTREEKYPEFAPGQPRSRWLEITSNMLFSMSKWTGKQVETLGQDFEAIGEYLFDADTFAAGYGLRQTRAVLEMIERAAPEFEDDIKLFARQAVKENPDLSDDHLAQIVAMRLSDKHEGQPNIGVGTAEQERTDLLREHRVPEPVSPDMPPFKSRMSDESEVTPAELLEDQTRDLATRELLEDRAVFTEAARMREAMRENEGKIPDDYFERHTRNPDYSDEFKQAVRDIVNSQPLRSEVPGEEEDAAAVTPSGPAAAVPAAAVPAAAVPAAAVPTVTDEAWYRGGKETYEEYMRDHMYDPAAVAETFDRPDMPPEQAERGVKFYVDEFKESMPDYEGASREEQGWAIFEAGMRIMAGQSPHAMTNISAGLKGLGTEFAKDAKEKRAWDRQVDLSAAKYGLESVKSDRIQAEALAKEKRELYEKMLVVRKGVEPFYYKGRLLEPEDRVIVPVGAIQDGSFPLDKVQSEASLVEEIKSANSKTRAYFALAGKQIVTPTGVPVERYIADSMRLRTNIATRSLLSRALVELQKPGGEGPLGVKATAKRALLILANALNKKQLAESYFGSLTSQNDFDDFTKRAVTTQIEGLINEGGKITNQERELALEIGGALSKGAWSGAFADRDKLERQIVEFSQALDRDSESRIRSMSLDEKNWARHYRSIEDAERGYSYGTILRESRPKLHDPAAPRAARVIPDSINWKDIIIVGEDGEVTGFKWDLDQ